MQQRVRVTKQFTFEMAHALYGYDGPCKNIHGHTYHLHVTLRGKPMEDDTHVKNGMVIDFGNLKKIVQEEIISIYDHALVLNEEAPYVKNELLSSEFEKVFTVPFQPTCENLMLMFINKIRPLFPKETELVAVILRETPNSYAEWRAEDNED
ncbi:MAG: 6-carboxytetrahydropterin synthase [Saprospiraceae bacterium]|nr:6-carboxytetrahydropterin synthase [Saprospiraceae bacterium]